MQIQIGQSTGALVLQCYDSCGIGHTVDFEPPARGGDQNIIHTNSKWRKSSLAIVSSANESLPGISE
ncbi:hypothetical protein BSLA_01r2284 [Burkholderia stabilis]|nr:hypothetical protein BSLA_01r2284 [Burkholderia stabilis]